MTYIYIYSIYIHIYKYQSPLQGVFFSQLQSFEHFLVQVESVEPPFVKFLMPKESFFVSYPSSQDSWDIYSLEVEQFARENKPSQEGKSSSNHHFSGANMLNIGGVTKKNGVVLFAQEGFWVGEKGFEKSQWAQGRGSPTVWSMKNTRKPGGETWKAG